MDQHTAWKISELVKQLDQPAPCLPTVDRDRAVELLRQLELSQKNIFLIRIITRLDGMVDTDLSHTRLRILNKVCFQGLQPVRRTVRNKPGVEPEGRMNAFIGFHDGDHPRPVQPPVGVQPLELPQVLQQACGAL